MTLPRLLILSLGGANGAEITPTLGAAELVERVPALADVAEIEARAPCRLPGPSLLPANLVEIARLIEAGFASGCDGAVVDQGSDTIEESAFILDLLVHGDNPVVVTCALRGAHTRGANGPANLLAAARVAASPDARGLGTLVVMNHEIHAARFVQQSHTARSPAFSSPLVGPIGIVAERRPRFYARPPRTPRLPASAEPPAPVALLKWGIGDDGRLLSALRALGYAGLVVEGMGAGRVPAEVAPLLGDLAETIPVVLATRCMTGPVLTCTDGYPGSETDLMARNLVSAGFLSGLKARLLLGLGLRSASGAATVRDAFSAYQ